MTASLRIAVADDEPDMRDYFQRVLPRLGHQVVGVAGNGRELVELCLAAKPDLVITDIKMPELDGIDAAIQIYRVNPVAVLLVSAHHDDTLIQRAVADHILGYLVKPIKQADLGPAIALAWTRFEEMERLRRASGGEPASPGS
jgi:two-component system, response regulator PdtaR